MSTKIVCGIDNGVSGSLVLLSPHGLIIDKIVMPVRESHGMRVPDVELVYDFIQHNCAWCCTVFCERPIGSKSYRAGLSMNVCFQLLADTFRNYNFNPITAKTWQKELLGKIPSGDTKPAALAKAKEIWPDEDWRTNKRCKVANNNLVDAALIGYYGLQQLNKQ